MRCVPKDAMRGPTPAELQGHVALPYPVGVPVLIGAGVLDTAKSYDILSGPDWGIMLVGVVASFVFALIVIRWLVAWVSKHDFRLFGWLRIITGVLILITGLTGWITWG